jgi:very-short-patch-repair endonuclease
MRNVRDSERRDAFKTERAQEMRQQPSDAERYMWNTLRGRRLGFRFRRQQPIGPYIVDFYCSEAKLIIEMDGSQHGRPENVAQDEVRTRWLEQQGYRLIRIWNSDFMSSQENAIEYVLHAIEEQGGPHPEIRSANFDPPSRGG